MHHLQHSDHALKDLIHLFSPRFLPSISDYFPTLRCTKQNLEALPTYHCKNKTVLVSALVEHSFLLSTFFEGLLLESINHFRDVRHFKGLADKFSKTADANSAVAANPASDFIDTNPSTLARYHLFRRPSVHS